MYICYTYCFSLFIFSAIDFYIFFLLLFDRKCDANMVRSHCWRVRCVRFKNPLVFFSSVCFHSDLIMIFSYYVLLVFLFIHNILWLTWIKLTLLKCFRSLYSSLSSSSFCSFNFSLLFYMEYFLHIRLRLFQFHLKHVLFYRFLSVIYFLNSFFFVDLNLLSFFLGFFL